ncbi:hypothetical protein [Tepidimicrobium xylanilyticum]|uniref:hypothetical protein n=1 Tax=Tepidimicrobium xylanilyticum TaxID=1123352 RepID=UPI002651754E|nr:hypothetical protein [Tepidimicrobium xylanilyticum]GMG96232.1 hypothetical protein EN5CB1_10580 [Tepidimicrobium xylanilyticum]
MKLCHKCNSQMVEVRLIDLNRQVQKAIVCTYCGRTYSKDKAFKRKLVKGDD